VGGGASKRGYVALERNKKKTKKEGDRNRGRIRSNETEKQN
jgi:hypothetical protein